MSHRKYSLFVENTPIYITKYIQDDEEIAFYISTLKNVKEKALATLENRYEISKEYIKSLTEKDFP